MTKWLDVFAGHGVGVAMRNRGLEEHAVEIWQDAIDTRLANGLSEPVYRDAWDVRSADSLEFEGLWMSPPCQTFSTAGSGSGRKALQDVLALIDRPEIWTSAERLREVAVSLGDERTGLVLTPLTYAHRFTPRFIALEQVTPVLPVWEAFRKPLEEMGYSVWTGILDAADYGVPQNRKRAYLIARRDGEVAGPPEPRERVTMEEVLGWGFTRRPAPTVTGHVAATRSPSGTQAVYRTAIQAGEFVFRPGHSTARSKVAKNGIGAEYPPDAINPTKRDALLLQSYPEDFVLTGAKASWQLQVGNAVPPKVAEAVLSGFYKREEQ